MSPPNSGISDRYRTGRYWLLFSYSGMSASGEKLPFTGSAWSAGMPQKRTLNDEQQRRLTICGPPRNIDSNYLLQSGVSRLLLHGLMTRVPSLVAVSSTRPYYPIREPFLLSAATRQGKPYRFADPIRISYSRDPLVDSKYFRVCHQAAVSMRPHIQAR
jgi:hypothetical protein